MKLALVNFYSGLAERGGETFVDSLATALSNKNEIYVFQAGKATSKPYQVISKPTGFNPDHPHAKHSTTSILKRLFLDYYSLKILLFTIKITPDLIKLKPDYIYPLNSGWQIFLLTMVARTFGSKIIVAGHSGPGWNDRVNLLFHPDVFVALTKSQADWAQKATPWNDQNISVIPDGVSLKIFSPKGKKADLGLEEPVVLAVGAATKSKRLKDTIKAVAKMGDTSLLICGTGPDEKAEDSLGMNLLKNRYKRLKVSHQDMPSIYRSADAFTLCSDDSEAFGIVYLEALASGLPCVVTDDASRREILGVSGIYVKNPENSSEYAKKLTEALKQKSSEKLVRQAGKYSWDNIARLYEKSFKPS
jgi:glycosyltransferase involved in cell wall biosynthesis